MTPDRWKQIEDLYNLARERGVAVLESADPEIRRQVESMLAQGSEGRILDRPAPAAWESFTKLSIRSLGERWR